MPTLGHDDDTDIGSRWSEPARGGSDVKEVETGEGDYYTESAAFALTRFLVFTRLGRPGSFHSMSAMMMPVSRRCKTFTLPGADGMLFWVSVLASYEVLAVSDSIAHFNCGINFGLVGHVGSLKCCFASISTPGLAMSMIGTVVTGAAPRGSSRRVPARKVRMPGGGWPRNRASLAGRWPAPGTPRGQAGEEQVVEDVVVGHGGYALSSVPLMNTSMSP